LHRGDGLTMVRPMSVSPSVREVDGPRPRAVVVGVQLPRTSGEAFESSLKELERLAHTLGLSVVARVTQHRSALVTATVVGAGKLKQLGDLTGGRGVLDRYAPPGKSKDDEEEEEEAGGAEAKADDLNREQPHGEGGVQDGEDATAAAKKEPKATIVLVDHDLTPAQTRNLEKATGAEVLDRSMVILSIFQRHARTREARIQVEIAQLSYMAPRLREAHAGQDRQRGGVGGKGAGETALELDRRKIRDRISELRRELEIVKKESDTRRSRRAGVETSSVALVGYTNAGKSSLMRTLTGDDVYVADQLFATLDTTVRVLKPELRPRILVSDTVGFIKKLPHDLVASFRSTLEEAKDASLLLHVLDASDTALADQYKVTREVLEEIGAGNNPCLLVLNKADRLSPEQAAAVVAEYPDAFLMSARSKDDVQRLHARIADFFEQRMQEQEFVIPYSEQRHVAVLHERTRVIEERYDEQGAHVRVRAPGAVLGGLRRELLGEEPAVEEAG
jgi:GTP-binding protein HflX